MRAANPVSLTQNWRLRRDTTLFQQVVPADLHGRIFSLRLFIIRSTMPLGVLAGGALAELWGTRPVFGLLGGMIVLLGIAGLMIPMKLNQQDHAL